MTIGERIKKRRNELRLSADEVAKALGKNRATIYRYESNDIEKLPTEVLEPLARVLQTTPAALMGWSDDPEPSKIYDNIFPIKTQRIPLLGKIACGEPIFADQERDQYIFADEDIKADFALQAKGDSMINARIYDGDIVFIRSQPIVNDGEIAAVLIDDEATLKRVYIEDDRITLVAENPKYKPIIIAENDHQNVKILGKAIAFQSYL